jgi:hypothetical protein
MNKEIVYKLYRQSAMTNERTYLWSNAQPQGIWLTEQSVTLAQKYFARKFIGEIIGIEKWVMMPAIGRSNEKS